MRNPAIKSIDRPNCPLCSAPGATLYSGLKDQLFSAPGEWNFSVCKTCGLLWLNPFPAPEELGNMYNNYYTHASRRTRPFQKFIDALGESVYASLGYKAFRNGGTFARNIPIFKDFVRMSILKIPASWGRTLLDVGSGNGEFLVRMRALGWSVEGTEFDPKAAAFARDMHGLQIHVGDLKEIQLPANSFDVITLNHVIEHSCDPQDLLNECQRILAPGGRVVLLTPNSQSLGHKIFKRNWRGLEVPRHLVIFSLDNFRILSEKVGLLTEELTSTARIARYLYSTSAHIRQGRWDIGTGGKRGYYLAFKSYVFQAIEAVYKKIKKNAGEEIFFVGKKV